MKLDQEPGAFAALKWVNSLGQKPGTRTQAKNLDRINMGHNLGQEPKQRTLAKAKQPINL